MLKLLHKFLIPEVKDLLTYDKAVKRLMSLFIILCLSVSLIILLFLQQSFLNKAKIAERTILSNSNQLIQSNISEQLSIIVYNQDFINYLHEGDFSRELNYPNMLQLFQNFIDRKLILGLQVKNQKGDILLNIGQSTPFYVNLDLCYLNGAVNNTLGTCDNQIQIFMAEKAYLTQLANINSSIIFCKSDKCDKFFPLELKMFGSFPVINSSRSTFIEVEPSRTNFAHEMLVFMSLLWDWDNTLVFRRIL